MGFKECDEDDFDFFCKDYEGMWFLLLIPGIMLVSTVVVSMMCYLRKKKNKDREIDAAHLNLDVSSRPAHIESRDKDDDERYEKEMEEMQERKRRMSVISGDSDMISIDMTRRMSDALTVYRLARDAKISTLYDHVQLADGTEYENVPQQK